MIWAVVALPLWFAGAIALFAGVFYAFASIIGSPGTSLVRKGFPDGIILLLAILLIASGSGFWYFAALVVSMGHFTP